MDLISFEVYLKYPILQLYKESRTDTFVCNSSLNTKPERGELQRTIANLRGLWDFSEV